MKCPRCQAENREGLRFCEDCGHRLDRYEGTVNRDASASHLDEAHALFQALRAPRYVERAQDLARELGVILGDAQG